MWHAETGREEMLCEGIAGSEDSVLCLNLSQNNDRLVASNSAGLVMVTNSKHTIPSCIVCFTILRCGVLIQERLCSNQMFPNAHHVHVHVLCHQTEL